MTVTIREASGRDRAAIVALLSSCALPVEDLASSARIEFLVAGEHGAVAACIGREVSGSCALLRSFAVAPACRNAGVGGALLREAEVRCRDEGAQGAFLLTTTAEAYFSRHGYARVDRALAPAGIQATSEFQTTCPVSAAFMTKLL